MVFGAGIIHLGMSFLHSIYIGPYFVTMDNNEMMVEKTTLRLISVSSILEVGHVSYTKVATCMSNV